MVVRINLQKLVEVLKQFKWPPEQHTHVRDDITDFWNEPFWPNIPDKPDYIDNIVEVMKFRRISLYVVKYFDKETLPANTTTYTEFTQQLNLLMPEWLLTKNVKIYVEAILILRNINYKVIVSYPDSPSTYTVLFSGNVDNAALYRVPSKWADITKIVLANNIADIKIRGYNYDSSAESILGKGSMIRIWIDHGEM